MIYVVILEKLVSLTVPKKRQRRAREGLVANVT